MRKDMDRLHDMMEAIGAIERHTQGGREAFDNGELVRVWCLRHLEAVGEASARRSETLRARYPEVPWREIIGMRTMLIHGYFTSTGNRCGTPSTEICPPYGKHLR